MSQVNVEIVRRLFDAVGRGDIETALRFVGPDGEWVNPAYAMEPGARRGLKRATCSLRPNRHEFICPSGPSGRMMWAARLARRNARRAGLLPRRPRPRVRT